MDPDLSFVIGVIAGVLAFPALLSAYSESRAPRLAGFLVVMSAGMVLYALSEKPKGTYTASTVPGVFVRVFSGSTN